MSEAVMNVFNSLNALNVNEHTEVKNNGKVNLTYLSWPWAWAEVKKRYPDASYNIVKNEKGLPYFYDAEAGIMCYTQMTIEGVTHEMWLPVMDGANNAMKFVPYEVDTYKGKKTVKAATMFDVNKTVMRCLVKNIAMFGLGLYIYAGEDLPESEEPQKAEEPKKVKEEPLPFTDALIFCDNCGDAISNVSTKSGKVITAEDLAKKSFNACGMHLCFKCSKKMLAKDDH